MSLRCAVVVTRALALALALARGAYAEEGKQKFVDINPSVNSTRLSACKAGFFLSSNTTASNCTRCEKGFTTEVWSEQQPGAMACEYPGPADTNDGDEDGEDSDDWVPSLAACKSTCVGTCPGIVWSSPTSPTSCTKCGAGMKWTKATDAAKTTVHRRQESGATQPSHCALCTDGLTWVATDGGITGPPARRHPQSPSRVARSRRLIVDKTMDVVNTTRQLRHWQLPPPVYSQATLPRPNSVSCPFKLPIANR